MKFTLNDQEIIEVKNKINNFTNYDFDIHSIIYSKLSFQENDSQLLKTELSQNSWELRYSTDKSTGLKLEKLYYYARLEIVEGGIVLKVYPEIFALIFIGIFLIFDLCLQNMISLHQISHLFFIFRYLFYFIWIFRLQRKFMTAIEIDLNLY